MKAGEFMNEINRKAREYLSIENVEIVAKDGKPIENIIFKIEEGKIVIE